MASRLRMGLGFPVMCGAAILAAFLAGCSGQGAEQGAEPTAGVIGAAGALGSAGVLGAVGGSGSTAGTGSPAQPGRVSSGTTSLPCDVADVLKRRCQSCHAAMPLAGVPMALSSWEDLQAPAVSMPELSVHALAALRVHSSTQPMPPTGQVPAEELAILDAWFAAGAMAGNDPSCALELPSDGGVDEPKGPPPDSTCYTLRPHGSPTPGDTSPWMVSNQHYACFYFDMPWPEGAQGVYFEPEFDEHPELVHHFVFYLDEMGNQPNGFVETCSGAHPSSPTMVYGWAPGAENNGLPVDVGMNLSPANKKLLLEVHYYHDGVSTPVPTTSGLKVCTANTPRANTATVSFLGTEQIVIGPKATGTAAGTCTPQFNEDIYILRSWPHMHEMGKSMKTVITRKDGGTETLGPWPFDFNSQVSYSTPVVIHPGDRLTTTCEYNNTSDRTITVGLDTQSEMCFNFVTAYPAKALVSKSILGGSTSLTSSATACLQ